MTTWTKRELKKLREDPNEYPWDDLRFPFVGRNLDTTSGRLDYNFYNGCMGFQSNAEFRVQDTVSMPCQMPHEWLEGSGVRPHIHWIQQGSDVPNWLFGYKKYKNGQTCTVDTDFTSNHTLVVGNEIFTYSSGNIVQITEFGEIDMSDMNASDTLQFCLWRDDDNDSGLFAGNDPSSITELALELDVHYRKRTGDSKIYLGSYFEYYHLKPEYEDQYGINKKSDADI